MLDPRRYNMPMSVPLLRKGEMQVVEVYSTAVTHQLRCLACDDLLIAQAGGLTFNDLGNAEI